MKPVFIRFAVGVFCLKEQPAVNVTKVEVLGGFGVGVDCAAPCHSGSRSCAHLVTLPSRRWHCGQGGRGMRLTPTGVSDNKGWVVTCGPGECEPCHQDPHRCPALDSFAFHIVAAGATGRLNVSSASK